MLNGMAGGKITFTDGKVHQRLSPVTLVTRSVTLVTLGHCSDRTYHCSKRLSCSAFTKFIAVQHQSMERVSATFVTFVVAILFQTGYTLKSHAFRQQHGQEHDTIIVVHAVKRQIHIDDGTTMHNGLRQHFDGPITTDGTFAGTSTGATFTGVTTTAFMATTKIIVRQIQMQQIGRTGFQSLTQVINVFQRQPTPTQRQFL